MTAHLHDSNPGAQVDPDQAFIPHIIYMLSFVMNVQGQYTGGPAISPEQREELRLALGLEPKIAASLAAQLDDPSFTTTYVDIARKFAVGSRYGPVGCPQSLAPFIALGRTWFAGNAS